jgi:hypothetical protein
METTLLKQKQYQKEYYLKNKDIIKKRISEKSKTEEFKEKRRLLNKKRKEQNRELYYKKRYGITLLEYNTLLINQDYRCAICNIPESNIKHGRNTYFAVDHCHITGKVRGLLCYKCNSVLGFVNDDIKCLNNAIKYLERC